MPLPTAQGPTVTIPLSRLLGRRPGPGEVGRGGGGARRARAVTRVLVISINPISGSWREAAARAAGTAGVGGADSGDRPPPPDAHASSDGALGEAQGPFTAITSLAPQSSPASETQRSRRLNNQAQISPPISGRAGNQTHAFWHQFSRLSLYRCSPGMPPSPENRILERKGVKNVPTRPPPQPHLFCAFFSPGLCNRKGA